MRAGSPTRSRHAGRASRQHTDTTGGGGRTRLSHQRRELRLAEQTLAYTVRLGIGWWASGCALRCSSRCMAGAAARSSHARSSPVLDDLEADALEAPDVPRGRPTAPRGPTRRTSSACRRRSTGGRSAARDGTRPRVLARLTTNGRAYNVENKWNVRPPSRRPVDVREIGLAVGHVLVDHPGEREVSASIATLGDDMSPASSSKPGARVRARRRSRRSPRSEHPGDARRRWSAVRGSRRRRPR